MFYSDFKFRVFHQKENIYSPKTSKISCTLHSSTKKFPVLTLKHLDLQFVFNNIQSHASLETCPTSLLIVIGMTYMHHS